MLRSWKFFCANIEQQTLWQPPSMEGYFSSPLTKEGGKKANDLCSKSNDPYGTGTRNDSNPRQANRAHSDRTRRRQSGSLSRALSTDPARARFPPGRCRTVRPPLPGPRNSGQRSRSERHPQKLATGVPRTDAAPRVQHRRIVSDRRWRRR